MNLVKRKVFTPMTIRKRALDYADRPEPSDMSTGRYGATVGTLTEAVKMQLFQYTDGSEEKPKFTAAQNAMVADKARLVLAWLFQDENKPFTPMSRKELQPDKPRGPQMTNGLGRWMKENRDGEWVIRRMFPDELTWILYWANMAYQKTEEALSVGDELLFSEILQMYYDESIAGDDQDAHWDMTVFESVEMQVNDPGLPDGAVWCEWCKDVISAPGIPCKQCEALGATKKDESISHIEKPTESPKSDAGRAAAYFAEL